MSSNGKARKWYSAGYTVLRTMPNCEYELGSFWDMDRKLGWNEPGSHRERCPLGYHESYESVLDEGYVNTIENRGMNDAGIFFFWES